MASPDAARGISHAVQVAEVAVLWAARESLRPGKWDFARLPSNHWRLYENDAPGGILIYPGGEIALAAGRVYLIPAGFGFGTRCEGPFRQTFAHFDIGGLSSVALRELISEPVMAPKTASFEATVAEFGERIAHRWKVDRTLHWWATGVVYEALGRCLSAMAADPLERYRLRTTSLQPILPALKRIQDDPGSPIANSELAALCHLSEDHFIRRFRDAVGAAPGHYLTERRVALAAHWLLFTEDSIETIATASGFKNRFYFSRVFTRETGMGPAAYRREPRT